MQPSRYAFSQMIDAGEQKNERKNNEHFVY